MSNRQLQYAYFDNSLTTPELTAIKQSFFNILDIRGFDSKGRIRLVKNGKFYRSNDINDVKVPARFCQKIGDRDPRGMNPEYMFSSINNHHNIILVSYYENLQDIHSMMTVQFEENQHGSIGVYLDALCVNNVMRYRGAVILLTKLVEVLEFMSTPNIEYIRLTAVPTEDTLNFYKRNNFQITGPVEHLIEHTRPIGNRTVVSQPLIILSNEEESAALEILGLNDRKLEPTDEEIDNFLELLLEDNDTDLFPQNEPSALSLLSQITGMKTNTVNDNGMVDNIIIPLRRRVPNKEPDFLYGKEYDKAITRELRHKRHTRGYKDNNKKTHKGGKKTHKGGKKTKKQSSSRKYKSQKNREN
jgi:hypothetical protein